MGKKKNNLLTIFVFYFQISETQLSSLPLLDKYLIDQ